VIPLPFKKGNIPWNKGKTGIYSEEYRKKLADARYRQGNPFEGRHHSEYSKRKISLAKIGKHHKKLRTEEHRKNLSLANKGRRNTWLIGIPRSIETKKKISERRKEWVIPNKDTKPERLMQIALMINQIRFEKHKKMLGQPDIFIEPNICIFIDGCYWHYCLDCNKNKTPNKTQIKVLARDAWVTHELTNTGFKVVRLAEHDILENRKDCANNVMNLIEGLMVR